MNYISQLNKAAYVAALALLATGCAALKDSNLYVGSRPVIASSQGITYSPAKSQLEEMARQRGPKINLDSVPLITITRP